MLTWQHCVLCFSVNWSCITLTLNTCLQKVSRIVSRSQSSSHSDWFISRVLSSVEERSATLAVLFISELFCSLKAHWVKITADYRGSHFVCIFAEKWSSFHHPSLCYGPVLCSASVVLPDFPPTQGQWAPTDHLAVPDCNDPPPALQQPHRAAGGDQDYTRELLPASQLEPAA